MSHHGGQRFKAFLQGKPSHRKGGDSAGLFETQAMKPANQESHMRTLPVSGSNSSKKALSKLFQFQKPQSGAAPAVLSNDVAFAPPPGAFPVPPMQQSQTQTWGAQGQEQQQPYAPTPAQPYPRMVDGSALEDAAGRQKVVHLFPDSSSIQRGKELHGEPAMSPPAPTPSQAMQYNAPHGQMPQLPPLTTGDPLELPDQHQTAGMTALYPGPPLVPDPRRYWKGSDGSTATEAPSTPAEPQVLPVSRTDSGLSGTPAAATEHIPHRERKLPEVSASVSKLLPSIPPLRTNKRQSVPPRVSSEGKVLGMNALKNTEAGPPSPARTVGSQRAVVGAPHAEHSQGTSTRGNESGMGSQAEANTSQKPPIDSQPPTNGLATGPTQDRADATDNIGMPGVARSRPSSAGDATPSDAGSVLQRQYSEPQMPVSGAGADNRFSQPPMANNRQSHGDYPPVGGNVPPRRAGDAVPAGTSTMGPSAGPGNVAASYRAFKPSTSSERPSREVQIQQMILPYGPELIIGHDGAIDWVETLMVFVPRVLDRGNVHNHPQGPRAAGSRGASDGRGGGAPSGYTEKQLQEEIAALQNRVATLEHTKRQLQEDLRISRNKSTNRGEAIRAREDEIAQLKRAIGTRESELKREYDDAAARLSRADADREALDSKLVQARNEIESHKAQNAALTESHAKQIKKYEEMIEAWDQALKDERVSSQAGFAELERGHRENLAQQKMAYDAAVKQCESKFMEELKRVQQDHAAEVARLNGIVTNHSAEMEEAEKRHTSEVQDLKAANSKTLAELKSKFEKETRGLRNRMAAYSTGTYTAIPDSDLVVSLRRLAQDISNLSLYVPQPAGYVPSPEADPTNHVARSLARGGGGGSSTWPRFVQSVCWAVVLRGFFHMPLGFGALGCQGAGYQIMMPLFEVFLGTDLRGLDGAPIVLPHDKEANAGRAWLFASILRDVKKGDDEGGGMSSSTSALAAIFEENVALVARDLTAQLQHISNGGLDPSAEAQVGGVVRAIGIFALEMGSQRAQVSLETCRYGDLVTLGDKFGDGKSSSSSGGGDGWGGQQQVQVDLLTQPCLVRTGDGREDLATRKVIVKGDIITL